MTMDEVESGALLGRDGVCVSLELELKYANIVREVWIRGLAVDVVFNSYGEDDGGPIYRKHYSSLQLAIDELEPYLKLALEDWENFTASGRYPLVDDRMGMESRSLGEDHDLRDFGKDVQSSRVEVPSSDYVLFGQGYWSQLVVEYVSEE